MNTTGLFRRARRAGVLQRRLRAGLAFGLLGVFALPVLAPAPTGAQSGRPAEQEAALFPVCSGSGRVTCVVDGDTIWYRGTKIRIADIDTPEITRPACEEERILGRRATERMRELLNAGSFRLDLPPDGRTRDRYGRELRIVTRGGQSLGNVLVSEGLAARWGGPRRSWC